MNYKLILFFLLFAFFIIGISSIFISSNPSSSLHNQQYSFNGNGTQKSPYEISSLEDFELFRDLVNSGQTFKRTYFIQTADIDLANVDNWIPIGVFGSHNYFYGCYDGGGHTIRNLTIKSIENDGLFGFLCGEVRNLGIESGYIEGVCVGSIASHGSESAKIINCYNKATIHGWARAGGIADNFGGTILFCWNLGEVTSSNEITGGIVSYGAKEIEYSYSIDLHTVPDTYTGHIRHTKTIAFDDIHADFADKTYTAMGEYDSSVINKNNIVFIKLEDQTVLFDSSFIPVKYSISRFGTLVIAFSILVILAIVSICFLLITRKYYKHGKADKRNQDVGHHDIIHSENEKTIKRAYKQRVLSIALVFIFVITIGAILNWTLLLKREDGITTMQNYYKQPQGSIDVLLLGSSRAGVNLDVEVLWRNYGISSYALWGSVQPFWNSYYFLKEAVNTNRPKMAVLEVRAACYGFEYSDDARQYVNTNGMRLSMNKIEAIQVSSPQEQWLNLLLGFPIYHSRFNELKQIDFSRYPWNHFGTDDKGTSVRYGSATTVAIEDASGISTVIPMIDKEELYFRKIIEFCMNEDIPLLLIATPTESRTVTQLYFNYVQTIADEVGVPFINFNLLDTKTGIVEEDYYTDNSHLNTKGGRKISEYLGQYLMSNYDLADHRGDRNYNSWDIFSKNMQNQYILQITDTSDYFDELARNNRTVIFIK